MSDECSKRSGRRALRAWRISAGGEVTRSLSEHSLCRCWPSAAFGGAYSPQPRMGEGLGRDGLPWQLCIWCGDNSGFPVLMHELLGMVAPGLSWDIRVLRGAIERHSPNDL